MEDNRFYVYALLDTRKPKGEYYYERDNEKCGPFEYEPFYIGKGTGDRYIEHFREREIEKDVNLFKSRIIKKIIEETKKIPKSIKIKENLLNKEALELEILLIKIIGRRQSHNGSLCNLTDGGEGTTGSSRIGINKNIPKTTDTRKKISESLKGRSRKLTKEEIDNRKKYSKKNKYKLYSPENRILIVDNLKDFCKNNKFSYYSMRELVNGKIKIYKGWTGFILERRILLPRNNYYSIIDPTGIKYTTNNLKAFCREFKLHYSILHSILNKENKTYIGWTGKIIEKENRLELTHFYSKSKIKFIYYVCDKYANKYKTENLKEFSRKHNLGGSFYIHNGMYKFHDWIAYKINIEEDSIENENYYYEKIENYYKNNNIRIFLKYKYFLIDPIGNRYETTTLKKFCDNMDLDYQNMWNVTNEINKLCKGWSGYKIEINKITQELIKEMESKIKKKKLFVIIDPTGKEYKDYGLKKICLENNLSPASMGFVCRGVTKQHKGWKGFIKLI